MFLSSKTLTREPNDPMLPLALILFNFQTLPHECGRPEAADGQLQAPPPPDRSEVTDPCSWEE